MAEGGDGGPMGLLAATAREHRYQLCDNEYCDRFPCRVYKEGFEAGHAAGFGAGYSAGHADGYAEGYPDGYAEGYADGAAAADGA